tara:strand:- start:244 stop:399 length:156 start_codon:yes stop_codon:yes gene_type:complete
MNEIVYVPSLEGHVVILGITLFGRLVVRWYDDDGDVYTTIIDRNLVEERKI